MYWKYFLSIIFCGFGPKQTCTFFRASVPLKTIRLNAYLNYYSIIIQLCVTRINVMFDDEFYRCTWQLFNTSYFLRLINRSIHSPTNWHRSGNKASDCNWAARRENRHFIYESMCDIAKYNRFCKRFANTVQILAICQSKSHYLNDL